MNKYKNMKIIEYKNSKRQQTLILKTTIWKGLFQTQKQIGKNLNKENSYKL